MKTLPEAAIGKRTRDAMHSPPRAADCRRLRGILRLTEAASEAHAAASDVWQYAVPIEALRLYAGLTDADLQWLVANGLAEHRVETTKNGRKERTFRRVGRLNPAAAACFIASSPALRLAEKMCRLQQEASDSTRNLKPHWDARSGELTWGLRLVKTLPESADSQRKVLDQCEEQKWAEIIDSPFSDMPPRERSRYLSRVLDHLNGGQKEARVHFSALDKGHKLRWCPVS